MSLMPYLFEAFVALLVGALGWRTVRAGAGRSSYRAVGIVLCVVIASAVLWTADLLVRPAAGNPLTQLAIPLLLSIVAWIWSQWWWQRAHARRDAWSDALTQRPAAARLVLVLVLIAQAALVLLVVAVMVNLIARQWPASAAAIRNRTLIARHLLVGAAAADAQGTTVTSGSPGANDDAVRVAMQRQRQLAGGLGRLFADGRTAVADATGMSDVLEAIDILREIGDLEPDQKLWLVRNEPALARLVDYPPLHAVATDPNLLDEIERVARGSLTAAWRIGDRADIQALFEDPEIRAAIAGIHLADLRNAWRTRTATGTPVPIAWRWRAADRTTIESAVWHELALGSERCSFFPSGAALVVVGGLPGYEMAAYRLTIGGLTAPRLKVAGKPCLLQDTADGWQADLRVHVVGGDIDLTIEAQVPSRGMCTLALSRVP